MSDKKDKLPNLDMERAKPLRDWLNERNARCAWQIPATKQNPRAIEGWIVNGHVVVIICAEYGWELYTQPSTNNIDSTLIDAERRIGLDPAPTLWRVRKRDSSLTTEQHAKRIGHDIRTISSIGTIRCACGATLKDDDAYTEHVWSIEVAP